jgi:hypothetical protein
VWIVPDHAKVVTGDERAVVFQFRYFDESETMGLQIKISISQIRDVLSLAQNQR